MNIDKSIYSEMRRMYLKISAFEGRIKNQVDQIIRCAYSSANKRFVWWDWKSNGCEDNRVSFDWTEDTETYIRYFSSTGNIGFTDEYGNVWDLAEEFPMEWLFMDIDDVKNLIDEGIKRDKEHQKRVESEIKEKVDKSEAKKNKLLESVKSKLTPEERKALGVK